MVIYIYKWHSPRYFFLYDRIVLRKNSTINFKTKIGNHGNRYIYICILTPVTGERILKEAACHYLIDDFRKIVIVNFRNKIGQVE